MELFRAFLSLLCFIFAINLAFDLILSGFDWLILLAMIVGYSLAHWIWPKKRKADEDEPAKWLLDILELIIELPFRALSYVLRSVSRSFRDGGPDFDI